MYVSTCTNAIVCPGMYVHENTLNNIIAGETYTSLQYLYRIPATAIGQIVPEICDAIITVFKDFVKVHNLM